MVFPAVPRLMFFRLEPAALPPMLPAISWIIRLMMVADTSVLLAVGNLLAAANARTAACRLPWAPLRALPRATLGHGRKVQWPEPVSVSSTRRRRSAARQGAS